MGIIIRQSLKNSVVTYAGVLIGIVNVLWLSTAFLTKDKIALTRVLVDNALLFASLAQLSTSHIAVRFFSHFRDESRQYNGFLGFLLLFPLAGLALFSVAYVFFRPVFKTIFQEHSPQLVHYYYYVLPLVVFLVYIHVLEAYARVHLRIVVPAIIREIFLKAVNAGLILLYAFHYIPFERLVTLLIASYGVAVLFLLAYIKNLGRLYLRLDFSFVRTPLFRQIMSYSFFVILGGLGSLLASKIDSIMLPAYEGGLSATGIYVIAVSIGIVIEVPRRALSQIAAPILSTAWKENDLEKIADLYHRTALNQLIIGAFLFLGIWCNIDAIFNIMPNGDSFRAGKMVVLFIALSRLVDMATGVNSEIIINSKYYKFDLFAALVLAFFTIGLNLWLIPRMGINGAALGMLISVAIYNLVKFLFIWIVFKIQPFSIKTLITVLITGITFFAAMLFPSPTDELQETVINILLRSAVITVLFIGLMYLFRVSEDANSVAVSLYARAKSLLKNSPKV